VGVRRSNSAAIAPNGLKFSGRQATVFVAPIHAAILLDSRGLNLRAAELKPGNAIASGQFECATSFVVSKQLAEPRPLHKGVKDPLVIFFGQVQDNGFEDEVLVQTAVGLLLQGGIALNEIDQSGAIVRARGPCVRQWGH
jgi:hypothetical protein